ncbi:T9SS type B sorting domain-containing protein [Allomuricauda sp. R78024]|uniref:T9SS type B sorting domain-containing protein n=1 Tax=Allomuricauda sp. R78024 TaxID=3093867 RepID=UPI0037C9C8EB
MTKHLHFNKFYGLKKPKWTYQGIYPFFQYALVLLFLFGLGFQIHGQTRNDTWFRAGKAVNSDPGAFNFYDHNPLPPGNNTSVTTWFDIVDFVSQDAIPHPAAPGDYPNAWNAANPGFDYSIGSGHLHPTGTVPGVPTFRRNATDNINFNPVVQFDGTGDGQALHFHSVVREDVAVFIVFKAVGAGNSAETQRLLFGGAVDTLHTSASQNQWTGNLSLGIADNNRFSIGRNWFTGDRNNYDIADNQTFYQSGTINLLGEPAIGAFTRTIGADQETLVTHVNGIQDINLTRNDTFADNPLFDYNRLGKHFNSSTSDYNLAGDIAEVLVLDVETLNPITNNIRQRVESYLAVKYGITLTDDNQLGSIVGNGTYDYLAADGAIIWTSDVTYMYDIAGIGVDRHGSVGAPDYRLWYNLDQRISKSVNSDAIVTVSTNTDFSTDNLDLTRTRISGDGFSLDHNYLLWANNDLSINATTSGVPLGIGITHKLDRQWMVQLTRTASSQISDISIRLDLSGSDILSFGDCVVLLIDEDGDGDFTTGTIRKVVATSIDNADNAYFDGITFSELTGEIFTVGIEVLDAGDDTTIDICMGDVIPYDLTAQLNGTPDPGGTWTDVDNTFGNGANDVITDPANVDFSSLVVGTYDFNYTISNALMSCPDETATLTVNIVDPAVNAGDNASICGLTNHDIQNASASGHDSFTWSIPSGDGSLINDNTLSPTYQPHANDIGTTVIIQLEVVNSAGCDATDTVELIYIEQPTVDVLADVTVCDSFTLPALTTGNYFTGAAGTGVALLPGDNITTTQTVFIYQETGTTPNCSDQSSFTVTVNNTPTVDVLADVTVCDSFTLPALTTGNYFTGAAGTGVALLPGDNITTTQTVFIYQETGTTPNCSDQSSFTVTVNNTPTVDVLADVTVCDSFTLPALTTGNYFTGAAGTGVALLPGDNITTTQTVFIYQETGTTPNCSDQSSFTVTVNNTPTVDVLADVTVCDSFTLPALTTGNYFTGAAGTGVALLPGDNITTTQTVFIYQETGTTPNCSDQSSFTVTVNNTPTVDVLADVTVCDSFTLPALTTGNYFTGAAGTGVALLPGDNITTTQTVFIYQETGTTPNCSDQSSFTVTVNNTPTVDVLADVTVCDSFTLPALTTGNYFTGAAGTGVALLPGDITTTTQTVFIYQETGTTPNCSDQSSFTVTVNNTPTVDVLADVTVCDSFTLPALTTGNYFTGAAGTGVALLPGDNITVTSIIYVFSPGTGSCPNVENSFVVTITGFEISTNIQNETCWETSDGNVEVNADTTNFPLTVQLNSLQPMVFVNNSFEISGLSPGSYAMTIIDNNGCQSETTFDILPGGPNLDATIEPFYSCDSGIPTNSIEVSLIDSSISSEVLYALDSTNPNDFVLSPDFQNISVGNHTLSIMHNNGCLLEIPFIIENVALLSMTLTNENINQISANATGGFPPYTYYFDNNVGSSSNTYNITRSGTFTVTAIDSRGCEATETITLSLIDITIPNFFTPNNDGQNDFWKPRNMELFPDVQTFIFDRYGRKIKIMGAIDDGWDGYYEAKALPSGDYWYVIKLNDDSGREYVGHFTLYR